MSALVSAPSHGSLHLLVWEKPLSRGESALETRLNGIHRLVSNTPALTKLAAPTSGSRSCSRTGHPSATARSSALQHVASSSPSFFASATDEAVPAHEQGGSIHDSSASNVREGCARAPHVPCAPSRPNRLLAELPSQAGERTRCRRPSGRCRRSPMRSVSPLLFASATAAGRGALVVARSKRTGQHLDGPRTSALGSMAPGRGKPHSRAARSSAPAARAESTLHSHSHEEFAYVVRGGFTLPSGTSDELRPRRPVTLLRTPTPVGRHRSAQAVRDPVVSSRARG